MLSLMEAGGVGFLFALLVTPLWIRYLRRHSYGQQIREDGPSTHLHKAGTPTMGGVVIMLGALLGYLMGHVGTSITITRAGVLAMSVTLASGLLGFVDDLLAIRNARNLGLNKRGKFAGQFAIAAAFAILGIDWVHTSTRLSFTRLSLPGWNLTASGWMVLAVFVVIATSNAVNLTDGLDGLAAGSATFCFGVLSIIGYWQFRHYSIYQLHAALDLGLVAVALVGACLGFLWWNAAPAKIIMGDTGSLAIGSALAAVSLLMNLDLLLVVIGGLFVAETSSVILQVLSFRLFGRRIFRMAPFHHHFELRGWPETTVIIRFWILAGLLAALGLGIFYGDFLKIAKVV
ncbi:MAG: phospho-N-acetylmuramoyl-pentapeptide-transferase [Acidobacteriota bacterium]|nr:phospho-N-acetylmuramoyl-pentapeptide-transferase [Acidobacteriota bacterium]MDE3043714.1 phospho-N-acetylmuramoyl-pentapeptide-transferase [Acidobacteriota bacterium]